MKSMTIAGNKPGRVLVVDDDPENIQILHRALRSEFDIFFATSGDQGLAQVANVDPEIILLDVIMPGMDGYEVCRQLKANAGTRDIPVIFITALSDENDETQAFSTGAVDYIAKPIRPAVVRARVRTHLELKRQREFLAKLSSIDGLTGIFNRRHFDELFQLEWRRSLRNNAVLAVILADVDHFKLFNDHYGHQMGDDCLKEVAELLGLALQRPADCLARYGGEEFVCILPETTDTGGLLIAERMRTLVETKAIPHQFSPTAGHVTLSAGVASGRVGTSIDSPDALLQMADLALYEAKRKGRNQVVLKCAGEAEPS